MVHSKIDWKVEKDRDTDEHIILVLGKRIECSGGEPKLSFVHPTPLFWGLNRPAALEYISEGPNLVAL